jgi:hypothetical protein
VVEGRTFEDEGKHADNCACQRVLRSAYCAEFDVRTSEGKDGANKYTYWVTRSGELFIHRSGIIHICDDSDGGMASVTARDTAADRCGETYQAFVYGRS